MYAHEQIWQGLDRLAAQQGVTISALAKKAGLDATTFNKSKRHMPDGRPRWPSTESLLKVLNVCAVTLAEFDRFMNAAAPLPEQAGSALALPLIPLSHYHIGTDRGGETEIDLLPIPTPIMRHPNSFCLEVDHDQWDPRVKAGQILYVAHDVEIRRGDLLCMIPVQADLAPLLAVYMRETSLGYDFLDWRESGMSHRVCFGDVGQLLRVLAILM